MGIKVMVQIDRDVCKKVSATTTAEISAQLTIAHSYYEERTIPDGIDITIDPELPDGWMSRNPGGYYTNTVEHRCPECADDWKRWKTPT